MAESEDYYKQLAEGYELQIHKLLKPSVDTITVIGVIMSMLAEVEGYGAKSGQNEKYKSSKERILLLFEYAEGNNVLSNRNNLLRLQLKNSHSREYYLQKELTELKTKLQQIDDFNKE